MADLHDALRRLGADVRAGAGGAGHLPVLVRRGSLRGGKVDVRGDVSSQFVSALMLIGPVLPEGLDITVTGELVSRPYVEMTASVMRSFGARVTVSDDRIVVGVGGYVATGYEVEPDFSSAAFPMMALAFTPGSVTVPGLGRAVLQGDSFVLEVARMMGMSVDASGADVTVRRGPGGLRPVEVDLRDASDLVPAVAVACTALPGRSVISGVGFIREKESDRLGDLAAELNAGGSDVQVADDGLVIHGGGNLETAHRFATHHDHRLAMAFSLPAAGGHSRTVADHGVVAKSWPGYFDDMSGVLGVSGPLN